MASCLLEGGNSGGGGGGDGSSGRLRTLDFLASQLGAMRQVVGQYHSFLAYQCGLSSLASDESTTASASANASASASVTSVSGGQGSELDRWRECDAVYG
jgi:hypothetical protein